MQACRKPAVLQILYWPVVMYPFAVMGVKKHYLPSFVHEKLTICFFSIPIQAAASTGEIPETRRYDTVILHCEARFQGIS